MFIFDEIACAIESVGMFVEEKVDTLRDPSTWGGNNEEVVVPNTEEESDFDKYLRDCANSVLFPCGVPESIKKEREREAEEARKAAEKMKREQQLKEFALNGISSMKNLGDLFTDETKEMLAKLQNLDEVSEEDRTKILDELKNESISINLGALLGLVNDEDKAEEKVEAKLEEKKSTKTAATSKGNSKKTTEKKSSVSIQEAIKNTPLNGKISDTLAGNTNK